MEINKTDGIEELKRNWMKDPVWDIEDTEGFEAHREHLLAFRLKQEAEWERQKANRINSGQEWVDVAPMIDRLKVPGGWIYRTNEGMDCGNGVSVAVAMCFVPECKPEAQQNG